MIRWGLSVSHPPCRPPGRPPSHPSHTACGTCGGSLRRRWKAWKVGRAGRGRARGGRCRPSLALPPSPGLGARTALNRGFRLMRLGCHGRTHWAPAPEALSLRPPRVKARHAVPPQIASRLRSRRLVREPPALPAPAMRTDLDPVRPAGPQGKQRLRRAPRCDAHRTRRLSSGRRR